MTKRKVRVAKVHGRWQPIDNEGWIVCGTVYNVDGMGYATQEGAEEAAAVLR